MILILTLAYLACVIVAFKVLKFRVNPTSVAVAVVGGVLLLGGIVTVWKLASQMTDQMTLRRIVLRIVPNQREFVTRVHVKSNDLVTQGQPLFEVSRERFENAVDSAEKALATAETRVQQADSTVAGAAAGVRKAEADVAAARAKVKVAESLKRSSPGAISTLRIDQAEAAYDAARAQVEVSKATLQEAEAGREAAVAAVDVARASLQGAEYQLEQTVYRSSVNGRVVNFQVREGTPVARWQFTAVGTLMDLDDNAVLAVYPQNLLSNVATGDVAEVAFRRRPGTIATGKVEAVIKYTGEGQLVAADRLPSAAAVGSKGFLAVRIRLDDEELARTLPLGAAGTTAIYTGFAKPFHVISKIALRIKGWLFYLPA
jgi:multidrug resistance efflux pump